MENLKNKNIKVFDVHGMAGPILLPEGSFVRGTGKMLPGEKQSVELNPDVDGETLPWLVALLDGIWMLHTPGKKPAVQSLPTHNHDIPQCLGKKWMSIFL